MKRKFLGVFLLLSVVAALTACGSSSNASEEDEDCLLDQTKCSATELDDPIQPSEEMNGEVQ